MKIVKSFKLILPVIVGIAGSLYSCSGEDKIEEALRKGVENRITEFNPKYRLVEYQMLDTVTVARRIELLEKKLDWAAAEPNLDEFKAMRNREFKEFRKNDPEYETKVLNGELENESLFDTILRMATETADSLIANWDKVDAYNYDFAWLRVFYMNREAQYYGAEPRNDLFEELENAKRDFDELASLRGKKPQEALSYIVKHDYSIFSPVLEKRVPLGEIVLVSSSYEVVRRLPTSDESIIEGSKTESD